MEEKVISEVKDFVVVVVCASDEALGFFEAFHELLTFLVSFLGALIGLLICFVFKV